MEKVLSALGQLGWNVEELPQGLTLGQDGSLESGVLQSDVGPGHTPHLKGAQGPNALRVTCSQSRLCLTQNS